MTVIKHPINSAKEFDRFVRLTSKLESKIFQIWLLSSSTALGGYYYFIFQSTNFFQRKEVNAGGDPGIALVLNKLRTLPVISACNSFIIPTFLLTKSCEIERS